MRSFLRRHFRWFLAGALVFVGLAKLAEWTTEAWFFDSVGQLELYKRMMGTRCVLFTLGAAWCGLLLAVNLTYAHNVAAKHRSQPRQRLIPLSDKRALDRYRRFWGGAALLLALLFCGSYAAAHWLVMLRLFTLAPTGIVDPLWHQDVAFYLFTLPALNFFWTLLYVTLWLTLTVTAIFYVYEEVIETAGRRWRVAHRGLKHLAALGTALLLCKAAGYRLSTWNLLTARSAPAPGFDWTALHIQLPLCFVLALCSVTAAAILWNAAQRSDSRRCGRVLLTWCATTLVLGTFLPFCVRVLYAAPRRLTLENWLFKQRRQATSRAFGLDRVTAWLPQTPSDARLRNAAAALSSWSEEELLQYLNTHQRRGDYVFTSAHFDTQAINGRRRPVFVAAREHLPVLQPNGAERETPGFGAVICDAERRTGNEEPLVSPAILAHPEIFFGDLPGDGGFGPAENSGAPSPLPDVLPRRSRPSGPGSPILLPETSGGGVQNAAWRRWLLAWRFSDRRLLHSSYHLRVAWHRRVLERCAAIAPFFLYEQPQLVLTENRRLVWIVNAHSVSDSYPLAEALSGTRLNTMRHAAIAVVDAFDGSTSYFVLDEGDPSIAIYRRLFPSLLRNLSELPGDLRRHFAYSSLLLSAQSDRWAHFTAPAPDEVLKGKSWQIAALVQQARWRPQQLAFLAPQRTWSSGKIMVTQLLTRPAVREDKNVLNGAVAGMLLATLERNKNTFQTRLWQWKPSRPFTLPMQTEAETAANFVTPISLRAIPMGDSLFMHYAETYEANFGSTPVKFDRWLLATPHEAQRETLVQGETLHSLLAAWWLRQAR